MIHFLSSSKKKYEGRKSKQNTDKEDNEEKYNWKEFESSKEK